MEIDFRTYEQALKEFLAEEQEDGYNTRQKMLYRYNNLKIFMDPRKSDQPHIIISIGISEAMYDLEKGDKISGGLGADERIVRRWIARNLSRMNLGLYWNEAKKVKQIVLKEEDTSPDD